MTTPRDPDEILSAWLDEGPTRLPDQTRRAIAVALPTTTQHRRGWTVPWRPFRMNPITRTALAVFALAIAVGGTMFVLRPADQVAAPAVSPSASVPASPEIVIPAGVVSPKSAAQVAEMALEAIAHSERGFADLAGRGMPGFGTGHPIEPARIIRIQLMHPGETYPMRHFDGTSPEGAVMSGDGGVGWVVETVGTDWQAFFDRTTPGYNITLQSKAAHRFFRFDDSSPDVSDLRSFPCWTVDRAYPYPMDGNCPYGL